MKLLLLILSLAAFALANPNTSRGFARLVASLQDDDSIDMEEVLQSEDLYLKGQSRKDDVFSEVELLIGEEEELADDLEDDDGTEDDPNPDLSVLPEELDLRTKGIIHRPIFQGACGSCGWICGTQTLEARNALVSENYIPYSIQNFMNCQGRTCLGQQPMTCASQARSSGVIVPEYEIPYTKKACLKGAATRAEGIEACYEKCGARHPDRFTNALDEQFVVITGNRAARSEAELIAALQDGPVTTCYTGKKVQEGGCAPGCTHANSIIGYTKTHFILQENYYKNWGPFKDGTWAIPRGSPCAEAIIKKAYHPKIYYDYDRANAYYTQIDVGVDEKELKFVDKSEYGITVSNTKNWGTAKNKCAFLGSTCKGVVALSSGAFELVSDFGAGSSGAQTAFKKFQMVVYLRHEKTGKYVGIKKYTDHLTLVPVNVKEMAAAFFTSYARFISFDYPTYHMVDNTLEPITGGIRDIDVKKTWKLKNCNIYNGESGNSFDLISKTYLGGAKFDKTSSSQRFDIGISGDWILISSKLGTALVRHKKSGEMGFTDCKKCRDVWFRWQARQITTRYAHAIEPDIQFSAKEFEFKNTQNVMTPIDCTVSKLNPVGEADHLSLEGDKLEMSSSTDSRWTFEYADL